MARRDIEPAVRVRLSPSCDAILSKTSAMLVRGDRVWRLDDREAKRLAQALGDGTLGEAVLAALAEDELDAP